MSPHAIANLRTSTTVEAISVGKEINAGAEMIVTAAENNTENEVVLEDLFENVHEEMDGSNLLIPEIDLFTFITNNFVCKSCQSGCWTQRFQTDKIGCATNMFWKCSNDYCGATAKKSGKAVNEGHVWQI
jgi:hypothetical protein